LNHVLALERLRGASCGEWGRLLGLDRIPEVRTLREKIAVMVTPSGVGAWIAYRQASPIPQPTDLAPYRAAARTSQPGRRRILRHRPPAQVLPGLTDGSGGSGTLILEAVRGLT
jgi:hypothetical protein